MCCSKSTNGHTSSTSTTGRTTETINKLSNQKSINQKSINQKSQASHAGCNHHCNKIHSQKEDVVVLETSDEKEEKTLEEIKEYVDMQCMLLPTEEQRKKGLTPKTIIVKALKSGDTFDPQTFGENFLIAYNQWLQCIEKIECNDGRCTARYATGLKKGERCTAEAKKNGKCLNHVNAREIPGRCIGTILNGKNKGNQCTAEAQFGHFCYTHHRCQYNKKNNEQCKSTIASGPNKGERCTAKAKLNGCCLMHHKKEEELLNTPVITEFSEGCIAIIKSGNKAGEQCCNKIINNEKNLCGMHMPKTEMSKRAKKQHLQPDEETIASILQFTKWSREKFDNVVKFRLYSPQFDQFNKLDLLSTARSTIKNVDEYLDKYFEKLNQKVHATEIFRNAYNNSENGDFTSTIQKFIDNPLEYEYNFEDFQRRRVYVEGNLGSSPLIKQLAKNQYLSKLKYAHQMFKRKMEMLPSCNSSIHKDDEDGLNVVYSKLAIMFDLNKLMKTSHEKLEKNIIPEHLYGKYILDTDQNNKIGVVKHGLDRGYDEIIYNNDLGIINKYKYIDYSYSIPNIPYVIKKWAHYKIVDGVEEVSFYHCIIPRDQYKNKKITTGTVIPF